jgi:hypothetical protein
VPEPEIRDNASSVDVPREGSPYMTPEPKSISPSAAEETLVVLFDDKSVYARDALAVASTYKSLPTAHPSPLKFPATIEFSRRIIPFRCVIPALKDFDALWFRAIVQCSKVISFS